MRRWIAIELLVPFAGLVVMFAASLPQGIARAGTSPTAVAPACPISAASVVSPPAPESPVSNRNVPSRTWLLGGGGLVMGLGLGYVGASLRRLTWANSKPRRMDGEIHAALYDANTENLSNFMDALTNETSLPPLDAGSKDSQPDLGGGPVHSGKLVKHVDDEPADPNDQ